MTEYKLQENTTSLSIEGKRVTEEELIKAVRKTGLLKEVIKEIYLERTLSEIKVNEETVEEQIRRYKERNDVIDNESFKNHLNKLSIDETLFKEMITRPSKVVIYRNERWGDHVNSLYLKNKESYDCISYNRVQSGNMNLMQEVYFRLKDREETWESVLSQFPRKNSKNGIFKDVPIKNVEDTILSKMKESGKGTVNFPISIGGQVIVTELVETKSSELDENLKRRILNEEFIAWIEETATNLTKQARILK